MLMLTCFTRTLVSLFSFQSALLSDGHSIFKTDPFDRLKPLNVAQTHIDKPFLGDRIGGLFDDSAVTMMITKRRRQHNAGLIQLGDGQVALSQATVRPGPVHPFCNTTSVSKGTRATRL